MKLRPFTGRLATAVELTTELTCVRVVSSTGAVALTVIVSVSAATPSSSRNVVRLADLNAQVLLASRRESLERRRHLIRADLQAGRGETSLGIGDQPHAAHRSPCS